MVADAAPAPSAADRRTRFGSVEAVKRCTAAGLGWTVLPAVTAAAEVGAGALEVLDGPALPACAVHVATHPDRTRGPAVRLVLERLRGRGGTPEPAQAAEHFVRAHTGRLGVDDVIVASVTGTTRYEAVVAVQENRYRVTFEAVEEPSPCGPECGENLKTFVVRDLTLLNEAALV